MSTRFAWQGGLGVIRYWYGHASLHSPWPNLWEGPDPIALPSPVTPLWIRLCRSICTSVRASLSAMKCFWLADERSASR